MSETLDSVAFVRSHWCSFLQGALGNMECIEASKGKETGGVMFVFFQIAPTQHNLVNK